MRSSLRAVSLAYFAHSTKDPRAQVESLRHYGQSLARQRSALLTLSGHGQFNADNRGDSEIDLAAAINILLATVILSYFELLSPIGATQSSSSSSAWINHTLAAERILVLLAPESLSNKIISQLFFSVRSHAVHRAVVLGHSTVFSEMESLKAAGKYTPRQSHARNAYDRVTEIILKLCRLRRVRHGVSGLPSEEPSHHEVTEEDEESPQSLMNDLKQHYQIFLQRCHGNDDEHLPVFKARAKSRSALSTSERYTRSIDPLEQALTIPKISDPTTGALPNSLTNLNDHHLKLQKPFTAMTTAFFHAAVILNHHNFPECAKTESDWDTLHNANIILTAVRLLSIRGNSNGTAVLRMMLPISVVWHFLTEIGSSTHDWQGERRSEQMKEVEKIRNEARSVFEEWCLREGMGGLVGIAFRDGVE